MTTLTSTPVAARPVREPLIDVRNVITLARKEIRDSLRNKWFVLYTAAFAVLALGLSFLSLAGTGMYGFAGFGRTAASLINLVMLIVPLMALTAGAGSIAGERERGTLNYLLSQPLSRTEVLLGKFLGLAAAMFASLALGFGVSAAAIASKSGGADAASFLRLVGLAYVLSLSMLSVGLLISAAARKASVALASSVFLWLALVFVGDLGLMGSTVAFKLQVQQLFHLSLVNPLQVFKMASLDNVNASLDVLGPAGLFATQTYGDGLPALFGGVLALWVVLPLSLSLVVLRRGGS
jgi:Cu-processing system permease protein